MATRNEMADTLATLLRETDLDEQCTCEDCGPIFAGRILETILPLVTTVAELEALPRMTVILDLDGEAWTKTNAGKPWAAVGYHNESSEGLSTLLDGGTFMVVWQP